MIGFHQIQQDDNNKEGIEQWNRKWNGNGSEDESEKETGMETKRDEDEKETENENGNVKDTTFLDPTFLDHFFQKSTLPGHPMCHTCPKTRRSAGGAQASESPGGLRRLRGRTSKQTEVRNRKAKQNSGTTWRTAASTSNLKPFNVSPSDLPTSNFQQLNNSS